MDPNKKLGRGCLAVFARTAAVNAISVLVVLALVMFSCVIASVVGSVKGSTWGIITGTILFAVLLFAGGFGFAFIAVYRRNQILDRAFLPIGLKGGVYRIFFRRYKGEIQGRQVELYFYRGPTLEVFIQSNLKTRLGVSPAYGDTLFFSNLVDAKPLEHKNQSLKDLRFWAEEAEWARALISQKPVQGILLRTLTSQTFFVRSFVKIFPDVLQVHFSGNTNVFSWEIPPDQVKQWFSDAFNLLQIAETQVPPPKNPIEMSSAERIALSIKRKDTTKISVILVISMLAVFGLIFLAAFLFATLVK